MDGHLALIEALAASFSMAPIGHDQLDVSIWRDMVLYAGVLFSGALRIALPAVTAILVVNLGLGVMSRDAPGMNRSEGRRVGEGWVGQLCIRWAAYDDKQNK